MRLRSATLPSVSILRQSAQIVLAALICFSAPISASAQVLTGETFVTETGDHTVEWNDNWTATLSSEDDFSTMIMLEGQIMIYSVMFLHDPNIGLSERVIYNSLSGVLTSSFDSEPTRSVEWEGEDGSYHGANIIPLSGIDFVIYMRVSPPQGTNGPIMQFAAAPTQAFPLSLDTMQEELVIDGEPAMDGEDGEDVMARLNLESSEQAAPVTQDESAPADSDSASSAPTSSRPNGQNSQQSRAAHIPTQTEDELKYLSADNGFQVTYTDAWTDMAESETTIGEFSLSGGSGRVVVSFSGRSTTETNREAFFEEIVARESRYPGFVGSTVSEDRMLIATWSSENELAVLEYVFVDDSTVVTIMVSITSGNPDRYIEDIQQIELNGTPIIPGLNDLLGED